MAATILEFKGKHAFLSNFHRCWVNLDGVMYPSSESAFMSGKNESAEWKHTCATATSPGVIKAAGYKIKLVDGWDTLRLEVMLKALRAKFRNPELQRRLLATGDAILIEGNRWNDKFWGVCIKTPTHVGENNLGKLLMQVRAEYAQP